MSETLSSLDRALDILLLIYKEKREMSITEISKTLGIGKSTAFRTVHSLEDKGFVVRDGNDRFWLGMRLYAMGMLAWNRMDMKDFIIPYARRLNEELHETVNICIREEHTDENPKCILIHKEYDRLNPQKFSIYEEEGSSTDCYCSAVGKCLLAFWKDFDITKCRDELLVKYTAHTKNNWQEIGEELEQVRKQGYAIENEECELGLMCIGAPIFDRKGDVVAAISIAGPIQNIHDNEESFRFRIARVIEMGKTISKHMI